MSKNSQNKLDVINNEIVALDEIIKLQNQKLELLRLARQTAFSESPETKETKSAQEKKETIKSVPSRNKVQDEGSTFIPTSQNVNSELNSVSKQASSKLSSKTSMIDNNVNSPIIDDDVMYPTYEIKTNYSISMVQSLTVKSKRMNSKRQKIGSINSQLISVIDQNGILHLINFNTGDELNALDLEHTSSIVATAYEATDPSVTIFISSSLDGSIHVSCIEVYKQSIFIKNAEQDTGIVGDGTTVLSNICSRFSLPTLDSLDSTKAYATGFVIAPANRGKSGLKLYDRKVFIGDNLGNIHHFYLQDGKVISTKSISPGTPISYMTRSRNTILAVSDNKIYMVSSVAQMHRANYQCVSPKDPILQVFSDIKSPHIVYAKLASGAIIVYNIRYKEPKNQQLSGFNILKIFSRKSSNYIDSCKIVRTVGSRSQSQSQSQSQNTLQNQTPIVLSNTPQHILSVDDKRLTIFESKNMHKTNTRANIIYDKLFQVNFEKAFDLFSVFSKKSNQNNMLNNAFDGISISTSSILPTTKTSVFEFASPKKELIPEPLLVVAFNNLLPKNSNDPGKATLQIYQFQPPAKEKVSPESESWLSSLTKNPMVLIAIGGLYFLRMKFSNKKKDREDNRHNKRFANKGFKKDNKMKTEQFSSIKEERLAPSTTPVKRSADSPVPDFNELAKKLEEYETSIADSTD